MVETVKKILARLQEDTKITLFVALKMDDFINSWSIVICGEELQPGDIETFSRVMKSINEVLTDEEKDLIARVGIFDETDYIPQLFADYKSGTEILKEEELNGFVLYEAHILVSNIKKIR